MKSDLCEKEQHKHCGNEPTNTNGEKHQKNNLIISHRGKRGKILERDVQED